MMLQLKRSIGMAGLGAWAVLGLAMPAAAVITLQSPSRLLTPPPAPLLPAYNLQAQISIFNATPISPGHFLAARHIFTVPPSNPTGVGYKFNFKGLEYTTTGFTDVAGTDLRVWSIDTIAGTRTIPTWAPIWNPAIDGTELGRPLVVFGRGVERTEAIYAPIYPGPVAGSAPRLPLTLTSSPGGPAPSGPAPSGQGDLRGWRWSNTADGLQSWGQNKVEFVVSDADDGDLIGFNFDSGASAVANEAILARNDSSGGVFAQNDAGQWKLIGVNLGVNTGWSFTQNGPYFNAAVFDARGLYYGNATNNVYLDYTAAPLTAASFSTRVSSYVNQLASATNNFGTGVAPVLLPEPATTMLAGSVACVVVRRRRRPDARRGGGEA